MSLDNATKMAVVLARKGIDDETISVVLSALSQQSSPKEPATMRSAPRTPPPLPPVTPPATPRLPFVDQRDPLDLEPTGLRMTLLKSLGARPMTSADLGVAMYGHSSSTNTKRAVDVAYALRLRGLVKSDWHEGFARHLYQITDKGRAWVARVDREAVDAE